MSDIKDLVPAGYRDVVLENMIELVSKNPEEAWQYLIENPIAILVFNRLKKNLRRKIKKSNSEAELKNIGKFFELYENAYYKLFSVEHLIDEYGLALVAELLTEKWRRNNQEIDMLSFNDIIMNNISILNVAGMKLGNSTNDKVTLSILADLNQRLYTLVEHERNKVKNTWQILEKYYEDMMEGIFNKDYENMTKVPDDIMALLHLSTLSLEGSSTFQKRYSFLLLRKLDAIFDKLPEDAKFHVAPYIVQLRNLKEEDEKTGVNETTND